MSTSSSPSLAQSSAPLRVTELDERLDTIEKLFDEDLINECNKQLDLIKSQLEKVRGDEQYKRINERLKTEKYIMILEECKQLKTFLELINLNEDWVLSYDGNDTKVWYKREQNSPLHSIKIEGTIRAPLLNVASLLYESDLYSQLFWYITSSNKLQLPKHLSDYKTAVHLTTYAPWPLYQRDLVIYAYAIDALKHDDSIIVISKSMPVNHLNLPHGFIPDEKSKVKRCIIHNSGFVLKPIKDGVTQAQFLYNVDPQFGFLPIPVINWFTRTMCRWSLRALESRATDLDSVSPLYNKRLNERLVYKRMSKRLDEYWSDKVEEEEREEDELFKQTQNLSIDEHHDNPDKLVSTGDGFDINMKPALPTSILKSLITASDSSSTSPTSSGPISQSPQQSTNSPSSSMSLRRRISSRIFGA